MPYHYNINFLTFTPFCGFFYTIFSIFVTSSSSCCTVGRPSLFETYICVMKTSLPAGYLVMTRFNGCMDGWMFTHAHHSHTHTHAHTHTDTYTYHHPDAFYRSRSCSCSRSRSFSIFRSLVRTRARSLSVPLSLSPFL